MLDVARDDIRALMLEIGRRARAAAQPLAIASAERKHAALVSMAREIEHRKADILAANANDGGKVAERAALRIWRPPSSTG